MRAQAAKREREALPLRLLRAFAERNAETGFADTPAGALRFAVLGAASAPELLLLHGLGDSLAGWARVLPRLARDFRVHAIDLPGHGLSEPPPDYRLQTLLAGVAEYAKRLRAPVLVGHSLGGWLAARLALKAATGAGALILVNPAGAALPRARWASFRDLVAATDAAGARAYLERAFHAPPLALRLYPRPVLEAMHAPASRGVLAALTEADFLRAEELRALTMPSRLVWGERDRLLPMGSLAFFRDNLPGCELRLIARAGHLPHVEAPAALARALVRPL